MKTKLGKMYTQLNGNFHTELPKFFFKKFNVEIETRYNFLSDNVVSVILDGSPFTPEQILFIQAFEDGYASAMEQVSQASMGK